MKRPSLKSRLLNGECFPRHTPGLYAPVIDKNGDVAKLHVLGPQRTLKVMWRLAAEKVVKAEKPC